METQRLECLKMRLKILEVEQDNAAAAAAERDKESFFKREKDEACSLLLVFQQSKGLSLVLSKQQTKYRI